jgi:hypothetical protein
VPFGLQIHGIANLIDKYDVISITTPFLFDRRKLPEEFMGLSIRESSYPMPEEFEIFLQTVIYGHIRDLRSM